MATFRIPHWFKVTRGLHNKGLSVLKLSKKDVSKKKLALASNPKFSMNGWHYHHQLTPQAPRQVEETYFMMTSKTKITNNELTLHFACGLLFEHRGVDADWVAFATHLHAHREKVYSLKERKKKQCEQGTVGVPSHSRRVSSIRPHAITKT